MTADMGKQVSMTNAHIGIFTKKKGELLENMHDKPS
jgi:hypothetical protein